MEGLAYALGGPPDNWFLCDVVDLDTGQPVRLALAVAEDGSWCDMAVDGRRVRNPGRYEVRQPGGVDRLGASSLVTGGRYGNRPVSSRRVKPKRSAA